MMRVVPWTLCAMACWSAGPPLAPPEPQPTTATPPSEVHPLPGGGSLQIMDRHGLADHMAQPSERARVYNVWATWCAPCIAEMPALEAFADAHADRAELWYINTDHPKVASKQLPRFMAEHAIDDRNHIRQDPDETDLTAAIPDFPQVLPATFVVAPSGKTTHRFVGAVDGEHLLRALDEGR